MACFANFWVESIDAYTGPDTQVILIGTHKDELLKDVHPDQLKDVSPDQLKDDYFEKVRSLFDGTVDNQLSNHIQAEDFAVDNSNTSTSGINELLTFILKKHQELVQTIEIPARWIQLEKALNDKRGKKVVTFQDVMNIDETIKFPLDDADQVKLFLSYHHDKGRLFYFDDGQPSDPIVLDPKFLIDAFKCIITSEKFVKKSLVRPEWIRLKQEGILTEKLIDKVWSQQEDFKQHKDVLLKCLSKHNILSQVMGSQSGTGTVNQETLFVVPSMLRDFRNATDKLKLFLDKKKQTQIRYVLKLTRPSVVQMIFHRITASMLGTWPVVKCDTTKLHFENMCVFKVLETPECKSTNHAAVIECIPKCGSIELRLVHLGPGEVRIGVADQLRRYVESFVMVEFRKLTCSYRGSKMPYSRAYRCNHEDHPAGFGSITTETLNENENENIRCPDEHTHEIDFFRNAKEVWFIGNRDQEDYPDSQLTEKHLSFLSQAFGDNWQLLGPALGIKETEMSHINSDHGTACMKIYHMLLKWKNRVTSEKATLDALVDVVKKYPKVTVGWDEFRNIRDEFNRESNKAGFIQPLSDKVVSLNKSLKLQCKIRRSDLPVIWQKNGEIIKPDDHIKISADDVQVLTVEKVYHDDTGTYRCLCGESVTECVVKVQDPASSLEIIERLSDNYVAYIRSEEEIIGFASFTCVLNRNSTDVTWFKREKCIVPSDKYDIVAEGTIHILKIKNVTEEDEDVYCIKAEGQKSEARLYTEDTEEERNLLQEHLKKTQDSEKDRKLLQKHRKKTQDIRILLVGRTGHGKSSTGNTIAGRNIFQTSDRSYSDSKTCHWSKKFKRFGKIVEVVDTPGILDTDYSDHSYVHKALPWAFALTSPGFHVIAFVLRKDRSTKELLKALDLFFESFGPGVEKFTCVILTDTLDEGSEKSFINAIPHEQFQKLVKRCNDNVVAMHNLASKEVKESQVRRLFEVVERIKKSNGNEHFTNVAFKLAE